MRWRLFLPLIFLLTLPLTSCGYLPRGPEVALTCEQIAWLQQPIGVTTSPEAIRDSVRIAFSLPPEAVRVVHSGADGTAMNSDEAEFVRWLDQRKLGFVIHLDTQGQVARIDTSNMRTPGDNLLACLGQPVQYYSYAAWEENGSSHRLHLCFPEQGICAYGADHWRGVYTDPLPAINSQFPFYDLMIVKPRPLEQLFVEGWGDYGPRVLQESKPWPGAWEKIEFAYKSSLER